MWNSGELLGSTKTRSGKWWVVVPRSILFVAQPYCSPVCSFEDMGTIESKAACIWAVLQCHCAGMSLYLVKYQGCPLVVKEMSLFMLSERVDPSSEVEFCSERAKKAEKEASNSTKARSLNSKMLPPA
jgi:hypothetical protein